MEYFRPASPISSRAPCFSTEIRRHWRATIPTANSFVLDHLDLGDETGSTGCLWLTGGQLIATNQCLATIVGMAWDKLIVSNGQFSATHVLIADGSLSTGTLVLNGGTATLSGGLVVGGARLDRAGFDHGRTIDGDQPEHAYTHRQFRLWSNAGVQWRDARQEYDRRGLQRGL